MLVRRNILPKNWGDAAVTLFTFAIIPLVFYFEMFIVLPHFMALWSPWYIFHFTTATFILFNVVSNLISIITCDTSIRGRILPASLGPHERFCVVCECVAPARSWHCNVCNTCILKRDHHCRFTSCCVGHHNLRFFVVFVFYVFIATLYASYFNLQFVYQFNEFGTMQSVIKLIFPLAYLFVSYSQNQLYLFLVAIILIAGVFTGVLLYYHTELILKGVITHERNHKINLYDFGRMENVKIALGEKWFLVWLSPFVVSDLPHEGVHWDLRQSPKSK